MLPKLDNKLTISDTPDVDGYRCLVQHIKMPMLMTNRSIVQLYYVIENEDGSLEFIASSQGTEGVMADVASIVKKDVIANNIINYTKLVPDGDGVKWVSV